MDKQLERFDELRRLTASDIMTSPVVTVKMTDSVRDVAKIFNERNISGAPVVDEMGLPIGVVTKTDFSQFNEKRVDVAVKTREGSGGYHVENEDESVEDWMTPFMCSVSPDDSLAHVARTMVKYGFHHVFVTDKDTKFVRGVITTFDILECLSRALNTREEVLFNESAVGKRS